MTESKPIPMTAVTSSAVASYGYDPEDQVLAVAFRGGRTYRYADVPPHVVEQLKKAKSVGKFITNSVVRGGYAQAK
jgi:hypothetical protein